MTIYRRQPKASRNKVNRPFGRLALGCLRLLRWAAFGHPPALEEVTDLDIEGRNKMLGLGVLGTIIVICLVVWLIRRAV
jgi:hypothetical protein